MASRWCAVGDPLPHPSRRTLPLGAGPPSSVEVLEQAPLLSKNHPSFTATSESGAQPALAQLQELLDLGFARLYSDRASAEEALGGPCYPAPLGDVVKTLPSGEENTA